jgi:hypothetical protein
MTFKENESYVTKDPRYHYQQAAVLMDEIVKRKNEEHFNEASATLLLVSAQTHLMAGILSTLMTEPSGFDRG